MRKMLAIAVAIAAGVVGNAVHADEYYVGQTGQYHTVPAEQDTQNITLVGYGTDASCPGGRVLYALNEWGAMEPVPFTVPALTVFVVTDATFTGWAGTAYPGETPWLNIAPTSTAAVYNPYDKASFLANKPLTGVANETFAGQGSLQSGATFALNTQLCAHLGFQETQLGKSSVNLSLYSVVVHGKVIDNIQTGPKPFSW